MPMSKEEMLARIQEGAKNQNQPELDPSVIAKIQQEQGNRDAQGWNMPITSKPQDPNDAANQMIQDHINQMKGMQQPSDVPGQSGAAGGSPSAMQQAIASRASNPVNPETGMPFYSAPSAPSAADAAKQQDMQMKMEALKRFSSGSQ